MINNAPIKMYVSSFLSNFINNYLNSLFSRPHPIHFSFGYIGENFFDIWKDMGWYCWPVCVFTNWRWSANRCPCNIRQIKNSTNIPGPKPWIHRISLKVVLWWIQDWTHAIKYQHKNYKVIICWHRNHGTVLWYITINSTTPQ